jgi:hypothetical protein
MFNLSFVNITPCDAHIHVEKTVREPSLIERVPYTSSSTVSLNSRSTCCALVVVFSCRVWFSVPSGQSRPGLTRRGVREEHRDRTWAA